MEDPPDASRLDQRIDQRVDRRLQDIGIYVGTEEALIVTRRDIAWLHEQVERAEKRGEGRQKTAWSLFVNVVSSLIAAAIGGVIAWISAGKSHP